ncbi:protein AATF [Tribolium castaneum]|uniref:Protein Aatf-like Protein n=1 Tax=Tribolium castaneum TaxID=7070 RepID=D6WPL3_TRICA|nr:PREDICTED: protein AATF [Tribolium castaneum]EFA06829.2 Protein Aatf-like Protein [Tribolium castaneum]|eukprot:XP_008195562.1 PREDICTED: protein AATF [Tribolium castaneum]
MKKKSTGTLADKIAGILNTAPSSIDPEDEVDDATVAKVVEDDVEENEQEDEILSKFRQKNIDLLADLDEKYAGKKTSRKNLRDSDSEDASLGSLDDKEEEEEETETKGSASESEDVEEESSQEDSEGPESNEDLSEDDGELSENDNTEENFKHISDTNVSKQIKKGLCVRNQMAMWENLLEVRIQLQKCLLTANKMPQPEKFKEIKQSDPDFSNKVNETKNKLCDVLDKLLLLQKLLYKQYPETKNLDQTSAQSEKVEDPDDEEIPSDTDVEESGGEEEIVSDTPKKKRKLEYYESEIFEKHKKYKDYRNNIIQKWNDKTRVVVKGGTTSHSVLDQIEYNLSNKDKLIKKTQLKRSQYSILGEEETEDRNSEEYNSEIFDDDDFYHQLLRELIEVKSADVSDPVQLSRQWIQLQNLRSKMKRKIDTRATKGRKIRYAVHSKLVNFMAPIDGNLWTDDAKNELYSSLFGKNKTASNL